MRVILITGDLGLQKVWKALQKEKSEEAIPSLVRHPRYLMPFLNADGTIYCQENWELDKHIIRFLETVVERWTKEMDRVGRETVHNFKNEMVSLLNLEITSEVKYAKHIKRNELASKILQLLSAANFVEALKAAIHQGKEDMYKVLSTGSLMENEKIHHLLGLLRQLDKTQEKISISGGFERLMGRTPYALRIVEEEGSKYLSSLYKNIVQRKEIKLTRALANTSPFMLNIANALLSAAVNDWENARTYASEAIELGKERKEQFPIHEAQLMKAVAIRHTLKSPKEFSEALDLIESAEKAHRSYLQEKGIVSEALRFRSERAAQILSFFYHSRLMNTAEWESAKDLRLSLDESAKILRELSAIIEDPEWEEPDSTIREKVSDQVFMNIASCFLFRKLFLDGFFEEGSLDEGFVRQKLEKILEYAKNQNSYYNVITGGMLQWALERDRQKKMNYAKKTLEKIEQILQDVSLTLREYEELKFGYFREVLKKEQ